MNQSACGACGDAALSAGCALTNAAAVKNPGYDTPHIPTRPVLRGTCASTQSIVSYVSVLSSVATGARHSFPRRHVHEVALGHESSANVLIHEDESFVGELRRRTERARDTPWGHTDRRCTAFASSSPR